MSFRDLRRNTAETDEQQPESMATIGDELGELHLGKDADLAASRRRFLRRAAAGGAIAFGATSVPLAAIVPSAVAQTTGTSGSTPGSAVAGTTVAGAAPKKRVEPTVKGADLANTVYIQTIELAAVRIYEAIIETGKLSPPLAETARVFGMHHQDHADLLATFANSDATHEANRALVQSLVPKIQAAGGSKELLQIAYDLEEGTSATYAKALGVIEDFLLAGAVSTMLPVEAQQALALSLLIEPDIEVWARGIGTWIPNFQSDSGAFTPTQFPAR